MGCRLEDIAADDLISVANELTSVGRQLNLLVDGIEVMRLKPHGRLRYTSVL